MEQLLLTALTSVQIARPPTFVLYLVLFVGALLFAGVALLIFTFYEDFYWKDQSYREQLRWHPSKRKEKA